MTASGLMVVRLEQLFLPLLTRLRKFFAPRNRPFICYVVLVALGLAVAGGTWSGHAKLPGWLRDVAFKNFNGPFLAAMVPAWMGRWGIELSSFCLFWVITQPMELRRHRWLRIGISIMLVYLLRAAMGRPLDPTFAGHGSNTFTFFGFLMPSSMLAGLWTPAVSFYLAAGLTVFVDSPGEYDSEPSLQPAYGALRAGLFRQGLRLVRPTLREHFHHYEALVLAACLHRRLNRRWRTRLALLRALQNAELFEAQRARLLNMIGHLEEPAHGCWQIPGVV